MIYAVLMQNLFRIDNGSHKNSQNNRKCHVFPLFVIFRTYVLSGLTLFRFPDTLSKFRTVRINSGRLATLHIKCSGCYIVTYKGFTGLYNLRLALLICFKSVVNSFKICIF